MMIRNTARSMSLRRTFLFLPAALILLISFSPCIRQAWGNSGLPEKTSGRQSVQLTLNDVTSSGEAPQLRISSFSVETNGAIHVDTGILLESPGVVRAQLRDGAVMNLNCRLVLQKIRTLLSNELLSECSRSYTLRHDLLTREFILSAPGMATVRQKQFSALLDGLKKLDFVLPLQNPLQPGEEYRVQIQFVFQHAEVPPWLEKALFFWSWEVAPPLSFSQDFVY